jgi:DNA-binding PadR family transcriptional regulator
MQESRGMHKALHLLGLLLNGPKTGYDLHRIVRAHGELYADLKKANVYYLLSRLAQDGYLNVEAEPGARGRRGERLVYSLTDKGRARFYKLLREVLRTYEPVPSSLASAVVFLPHLSHEDAMQLLAERRQQVAERREQVLARSRVGDHDDLVGLAQDHLLALIDADLAWTDRALVRLRTSR